MLYSRTSLFVRPATSHGPPVSVRHGASVGAVSLAINSPLGLQRSAGLSVSSAPPRNSRPEENISELKERLWNSPSLATWLACFSSKLWLSCLILLKAL